MTAAELRRRRTKGGLSQSDLARLLGVHPQTVAHWEQGVKAIGAVQAIAIHCVLAHTTTSTGHHD